MTEDEQRLAIAYSERDEARAKIAALEAENAALRQRLSQVRYDALEEAAALIEDEIWRGSQCANHIRALANKDDPA